MILKVIAKRQKAALLWKHMMLKVIAKRQKAALLWRPIFKMGSFSRLSSTITKQEFNQNVG